MKKLRRGLCGGVSFKKGLEKESGLFVAILIATVLCPFDHANDEQQYDGTDRRGNDR